MFPILLSFVVVLLIIIVPILVAVVCSLLRAVLNSLQSNRWIVPSLVFAFLNMGAFVVVRAVHMPLHLDLWVFSS